jgi:transposase
VTNEQFKQLQKENRRLREELDILKRAAVLLAKRWIYSFLGRQANN